MSGAAYSGRGESTAQNATACEGMISVAPSKRVRQTSEGDCAETLNSRVSPWETCAPSVLWTRC